MLAVRLRAPAVEGQANEALLRFIAGVLKVPRRDVELVSGATARVKRLRVHRLGEGEVRARLGSGI